MCLACILSSVVVNENIKKLSLAQMAHTKYFLNVKYFKNIKTLVLQVQEINL